MTEVKLKKQAEFTRQHTLTPQDLRKMIADKLERARAYHNAQLNKNCCKNTTQKQLTNKLVDATIELNKATKQIDTGCNRSLKI